MPCFPLFTNTFSGLVKLLILQKYDLSVFRGELVLNSTGIQLCREVGIEPDSMAVKPLSFFFKPGVAEDVIKMSFMHYEEKRKLKIAMLEEYDAETHNMTYDSGQYLNPRIIHNPKK